jgi:hypothetical protein
MPVECTDKERIVSLICFQKFGCRQKWEDLSEWNKPYFGGKRSREGYWN